MGSPFQAARIFILVVTEVQGRACKQGVLVTRSYEQYEYLDGDILYGELNRTP